MMTPRRPPAPEATRTDKRGLMDWLFGRTPPPPSKASSNLYLGDIVDGDFSSPSVHHHHKRPPSDEL
ncbi:Uncharacterised protein [Brevundimonas diminuta]|jgi:hypothetical protein|uniref:Uncharacterized protein n=1 Tax=Brevundimonas vancanneytii TaxID=1325724 RepID=A0A4P1K0N8_9CAUL|nr:MULTISPECIES: hypothetical protein [Brevundimonas]OJU54860.1 MAG: hypothetical protein BGO02_12320 [Brevundimonas sp. 67-6]MBD3818044.1 hypothetical protein [Brevundimonas diminuta]MBI2250937.1 hypothetical protein [Brevundimonas diminuta]OWR24465.1 hypothetical protein CD944_00850 [Brevundimonas diminuta]WQE46317.1 hypothetical protein U0020_05605 [Brevundimonas diminuta]